MGTFELTSHQREFMAVYGYLSFPGLLTDKISDIEEAFETLMQRGSGATHDGGQRSCMVPFLNHSAYLCTLLDDDRISGIAAGLLGENYQYWNSDGNYYVGDTGWHSDTIWPPPIRYYKMAIYLDTVTRETGALRVIPGSHRSGEAFAEMHHDQLFRNKEMFGGLHGSEVPAVALETQPGDLVVFDHATKHSAWGGDSKRRMFTIVFTEHHSGSGLSHFQDNVRGAGYTRKEVFGETSDGPLLKDCPPERRRQLTQLLENIPDTVESSS
ncbi:MAG: hypothetical protein DF168_01681 [Candidatus Moanabacter tarae]|uniref:Phytanoyl-CoA dioxygenase family protein n=1 Tax=Candidatus Moanibacter tarae TaxID=2200854 RepID=A0A2Z4AJW4_9BACT|nr:MAG: hypothetical protein DF168_01681 [Candidatus Moanabacter tarae]|tara:strand:- start:117 stop:923 length:807 start_codon:yes stop_codon:yes gene_type:complete